jgi:hypothetical protein
MPLLTSAKEELKPEERPLPSARAKESREDAPLNSEESLAWLMSKEIAQQLKQQQSAKGDDNRSSKFEAQRSFSDKDERAARYDSDCWG